MRYFRHTSLTDRGSDVQLASLVEPIDDESVGAEARVTAGHATDLDHVCTRIGVIKVFIPVNILIGVATIYSLEPRDCSLLQSLMDRIEIDIVILTDGHIEQLNLEVFIKPDYGTHRAQPRNNGPHHQCGRWLRVRLNY